MEDSFDGGYQGGETTGFQSPAQDHIEQVVDLAGLLDLGAPGIYAVRVEGSALTARGILEGDILIVNAAADPAPGRVAVAFIGGSCVLAVLERRNKGWSLRLPGKDPLPVSEDAEIWAIVSGLVRMEV